MLTSLQGGTDCKDYIQRYVTAFSMDLCENMLRYTKEFEKKNNYELQWTSLIRKEYKKIMSIKNAACCNRYGTQNSD